MLNECKETTVVISSKEGSLYMPFTVTKGNIISICRILTYFHVLTPASY